MAESNYPIPDEPEYDPNIRALQNSDEANADTVFNPLIQKLINNIHFLKRLVDKKADTGADGKIPVNQLPVDSALSEISPNPVQNKIVQAAIKTLNDAITAINTALSGKAASNHSHSAATTGAAGFMSAADKTKLDGIAAKATANTASTTTPKALGTASAGSEAAFARGDHVHPKPSAADIGAAAATHTHNYAASTSAGGAASTATKLATARTIRTNLASTSTASFDGSANISPGVTGTLPVANGGTGATTAAAARTALGITAANLGISSVNIAYGGTISFTNGTTTTVNLGFKPQFVFLQYGAPTISVTFYMNIFFTPSQLSSYWVNVAFTSTGFTISNGAYNGASSFASYFAIG